MEMQPQDEMPTERSLDSSIDDLERAASIEAAEPAHEVAKALERELDNLQ